MLDRPEHRGLAAKFAAGRRLGCKEDSCWVRCLWAQRSHTVPKPSSWTVCRARLLDVARVLDQLDFLPSKLVFEAPFANQTGTRKVGSFKAHLMSSNTVLHCRGLEPRQSLRKVWLQEGNLCWPLSALVAPLLGWCRQGWFDSTKTRTSVPKSVFEQSSDRFCHLFLTGSRTSLGL